MTDQPIASAVVADAGPLIHLDELDCLDLLNDFKQVVIYSSMHHIACTPRLFGRSNPGS